MGVDQNPPKTPAISATVTEPGKGPVVPTQTKVQQKPQDEDDDTILLAAEGFPAAMQVGANEVTLANLVRSAKKATGYSSTKWNELSDETRAEHLNSKLEELRTAAEKKSSTKKDEADTNAATKDVNVRDGRAVGGSYVALGGGERRRVGERSGGETPVEDEPTED